ncbi:hypothetical protein AQUCO_00700419v1 [Aquilegia coerulea]|uniref:Uncharacterized protein n=1 Tax=Aquilegia coerulea TaxID=218851 RepID=A0A2G5EJW6_AQUCA|nr:hypothetical protein AQUCO_00700419v1 [Aquilegia coerulea]
MEQFCYLFIKNPMHCVRCIVEDASTSHDILIIHSEISNLTWQECAIIWFWLGGALRNEGRHFEELIFNRSNVLNG